MAMAMTAEGQLLHSSPDTDEASGLQISGQTGLRRVKRKAQARLEITFMPTQT